VGETFKTKDSANSSSDQVPCSTTLVHIAPYKGTASRALYKLELDPSGLAFFFPRAEVFDWMR